MSNEKVLVVWHPDMNLHSPRKNKGAYYPKAYYKDAQMNDMKVVEIPKDYIRTSSFFSDDLGVMFDVYEKISGDGGGRHL